MLLLDQSGVGHLKMLLYVEQDLDLQQCPWTLILIGKWTADS